MFKTEGTLLYAACQGWEKIRLCAESWLKLPQSIALTNGSTPLNLVPRELMSIRQTWERK